MKRLQKLAAGATLAAATALATPGCENKPEIPQDAMLMSEGTGTVAARAPHNGTVYVLDTNDNKIVYKGEVHKNQLVTVDSETHRLTIDGETVGDKTFSGGHRHKILFKRNDSSNM
jgi:hypothetical protein